MRRHPEDVNPASLDLRNKEHLDAPQQHRVDVEEVARQQATRLGTQEPLPAHARQPRSRPQASTSQDAPHGALPHPVTQLREFALDPPVPPTGVLLGQPDHQLADFLRYRRSARAVRKAPVTGDQAAMPIEQRGWGHQPEPAQFLRQHTPEGGEHRPIRPGQSRARNLTAKDSDLMAQHQDLCLLPALRPAQQYEPTEQQASRHEGSSSRTRRSTKREVTASFALSGKGIRGGHALPVARLGRLRESLAVTRCVAFVIKQTATHQRDRLKQQCREVAVSNGWDPLFLDSAPEEGAWVESVAVLSRDVVAAGAQLVFAAGGDGTVGACAQALAGTGASLAILPLGTANLAACTLGVPFGLEADRLAGL